MVKAIRVAILVLEIHIPGKTSLKAKRQVTKSLIQRLRNQYNVSVSEIGSQDLWQKSELGIAAVCYNGSGADSIIGKIINFVEEDNGIEIISTSTEIY